LAFWVEFARHPDLDKIAQCTKIRTLQRVSHIRGRLAGRKDGAGVEPEAGQLFTDCHQLRVANNKRLVVFSVECNASIARIQKYCDAAAGSDVLIAFRCCVRQAI
jgi:hypothetical protein